MIRAVKVLLRETKYRIMIPGLVWDLRIRNPIQFIIAVYDPNIMAAKAAEIAEDNNAKKAQD